MDADTTDGAAGGLGPTARYAVGLQAALVVLVRLLDARGVLPARAVVETLREVVRGGAPSAEAAAAMALIAETLDDGPEAGGGED